MEKDKMNLYYLSPFKKTNFYDQFEWADELIQKESQYVFNSDFKIFEAKEIYEYIKGLDSQDNVNMIARQCKYDW